jgi:hypothetical protein
MLTFMLCELNEHEKEHDWYSDDDPSWAEDEANVNSFPWDFVTWVTDSFILHKALAAQTHICRASPPISRNHEFATVIGKATSSQGKQATVFQQLHRSRNSYPESGLWRLAGSKMKQTESGCVCRPCFSNNETEHFFEKMRHSKSESRPVGHLDERCLAQSQPGASGRIVAFAISACD